MKTKKTVIVIIATALIVVSICFVGKSFGGKIITINKNLNPPSTTSSSGNISAQNIASSSANSSRSLVSSIGKPTYSISNFDFITSQFGYLCLNSENNSYDTSYNLLFKTGNGGKIWSKIRIGNTE